MSASDADAVVATDGQEAAEVAGEDVSGSRLFVLRFLYMLFGIHHLLGQHFLDSLKSHALAHPLDIISFKSIHI